MTYSPFYYRFNLNMNMNTHKHIMINTMCVLFVIYMGSGCVQVEDQIFIDMESTPQDDMDSINEREATTPASQMNRSDDARTSTMDLYITLTDMSLLDREDERGLIFQEDQDLPDLEPPDQMNSEDHNPIPFEVESQIIPLYSNTQIHSPLTSKIVNIWREIITSSAESRDHIFMKIGASSTVSRSTLACFASSFDLGVYDRLNDTLQFFLLGNAQGVTPFDRETLAARVGKSAQWVLTGDPSPLEQEINALQPQLALIHYGTNDMHLGSSYASALRSFYIYMTRLVDQLIQRGILPVLTGISHRADREDADLWVNTYNATIRGIAQSKGLPFIDLHLAMDPLEGHGLSSDGLHLNRSPEGACVLDDEGLSYGYNMRNLIVLESLDRIYHSVLSERAPPETHSVLFDGIADLEIDQTPVYLEGEGTQEIPYHIPFTPFVHSQNSELDGVRLFDQYLTCDDALESGPEFVYQYQIDRPMRVRALVLDGEEVDMDVHLLDESGVPMGCIERAHHMIEGTLEEGTYYFVIDTWVNQSGIEQSGHFTFVLVECDDIDTACAQILE